jgi:hypothetical protein
VRSRKTLRVQEVPIAFQNRERGRSKMSLTEAVRFALRWAGAVARRLFYRSPPILALPARKLSHD